jgi:hypothetical protein
MHPTQSVQRTHPIQATHLVHATHARHATHSRAATHITVSRLAITPTLPAVPAEPATATLPAVATDPATATLPAVAADPAAATLPAAATDPATKTLSMPAIDPTTWPLSTATAESHESAIGPSCQPRDHSRRMRSALPWALPEHGASAIKFARFLRGSDLSDARHTWIKHADSAAASVAIAGTRQRRISYISYGIDTAAPMPLISGNCP